MMTKNFFTITILLLLALAGLGSSVPANLTIPTINFDPTAIANGQGTISPKCQTAMNGILADPETLKCLPVSGLGALPPLLEKVKADPLHNLRLLKPVFDAVCALPKCSDDLVTKAINALLANCQAEIAAKNPSVETFLGGAIIYSPTRDSICFQNPKKDYCLFESADNLAQLPPSPIDLLHNKLVDSIAVGSPNLICTPCNKAIVNTFFNYYNQGDHKLFVGLLTSVGITPDKFKLLNLGVDIKCGLPFNDGTIGDPTLPPKCP